MPASAHVPLLQVCCALAQIAKHSVDLAEVVVEAEIFPKILTCLKFPDELVRKHTATVVREVSSMQPPRWRLVSCCSRVLSMRQTTPSQLSWVRDTCVLDWNVSKVLCSGVYEVACQPDSRRLPSTGRSRWLHLHVQSTRWSARRQLAPPSAWQVAKHTPELAQLIVGSGGVGALVDYISESKGNSRLPGIMALGYIAAFSETLGLAVIAERGLVRVSSLWKQTPFVGCGFQAHIACLDLAQRGSGCLKRFAPAWPGLCSQPACRVVACYSLRFMQYSQGPTLRPAHSSIIARWRCRRLRSCRN